MPADHGKPQASGWVIVHPRYRRRFARWGLTDAGAFLDLPGEVVSGHPNRHVVRVVLGRGRRRFLAFLKREHRVPWRDRLANAWAGFGWVSKSEREACTLEQLRRERIPVPRWLAYGEDGRGRAFLLLRALPRMMDLRSFLSRLRLSAHRRNDLARQLGRLLARVHAAGFDCPDLWSKHVLVRSDRPALGLIDWQRARRRPVVAWSVRVRDLAALHASLADDLVSARERLLCLREYLVRSSAFRRFLRRPPKGGTTNEFAADVQRRATRLVTRRSVRELRRPPLVGATQRLRWIEGEALCVVRGFWRRCRGRVPDWLTAVARLRIARPRQTEVVWLGRRLLLRQSPPAGLLQRGLAWLRGRRFTSPGLRQSGRAFRLERFGVPGPRLLAFGQRPDGAGFILLQPPAGTVPLADWLRTPHPLRAELLRAAGALLRRLHDAGYRLTDLAALHVRDRRRGPSPILADVQPLEECRSTGPRDLASIVHALSLSIRDSAAFVAGYRDGDRPVADLVRTSEAATVPGGTIPHA